MVRCSVLPSPPLAATRATTGQTRHLASLRNGLRVGFCAPAASERYLRVGHDEGHMTISAGVQERGGFYLFALHCVEDVFSAVLPTAYRRRAVYCFFDSSG